MGSLPYFAVYHKGHQLHIQDEKRCSETDGVCMDFINKYLKIEWKTNNRKNKHTHIVEKFEGHICTAEDIGERKWNLGYLFLCPDASKINFLNNYK